MSAAWLRHSDFGDVAAELLVGRRPPSEPLTVGDVASGYRAMAAAPSAEARVDLMARLFARATPDEARYVARIAARELRIGLREGLLEEAIAAAFDAPQASVRRALMLLGEPGEVATMARRGTLDQATLHLGRPIRPMLATPVGRRGRGHPAGGRRSVDRGQVRRHPGAAPPRRTAPPACSAAT